MFGFGDPEPVPGAQCAAVHFTPHRPVSSGLSPMNWWDGLHDVAIVVSNYVTQEPDISFDGGMAPSWMPRTNRFCAFSSPSRG